MVRLPSTFVQPLGVRPSRLGYSGPLEITHQRPSSYGLGLFGRGGTGAIGGEGTARRVGVRYAAAFFDFETAPCIFVCPFARIGPNARRFRSLQCSRRRAPRSTRAAGSAGLHYAAGPWVGSCVSCTSSSLGRHCRNARSAASLRSKRWRPPHDEHQSARGSDAPETAPTWRQEGQMIEMSMPLSYHVCRAPGALQRNLGETSRWSHLDRG